VKTMSAPKGPHVYDVAGQVIYVGNVMFGTHLSHKTMIDIIKCRNDLRRPSVDSASTRPTKSHLPGQATPRTLAN
jgi:hypothetical protein